jgi:hypothetical protein
VAFPSLRNREHRMGHHRRAYDTVRPREWVRSSRTTASIPGYLAVMRKVRSREDRSRHTGGTYAAGNSSLARNSPNARSRSHSGSDLIWDNCRDSYSASRNLSRFPGLLGDSSSADRSEGRARRKTAQFDARRIGSRSKGLAAEPRRDRGAGRASSSRILASSAGMTACAFAERPAISSSMTWSSIPTSGQEPAFQVQIDSRK